MLRIYPVKLTAELETGSRLPTDEYNTAWYNSTRLNMFTFSIFLPNPSAVVVSQLQIQYTLHDADATQLDS